MGGETFELFDVGKGLEEALARINALRYSSAPTEGRTIAEKILDALFHTESCLAVYGTLAPGAPNHHLIEDLRGKWREGNVQGEFHQKGWGAQQGYPGMRWIPRASTVPVKILVSVDLEYHWERLDDLEGPGYQRILVPVYQGGRVIAVANIYEARL